MVLTVVLLYLASFWIQSTHLTVLRFHFCFCFSCFSIDGSYTKGTRPHTHILRFAPLLVCVPGDCHGLNGGSLGLFLDPEHQLQRDRVLCSLYMYIYIHIYKYTHLD